MLCEDHSDYNRTMHQLSRLTESDGNNAAYAHLQDDSAVCSIHYLASIVYCLYTSFDISCDTGAPLPCT